MKKQLYLHYPLADHYFGGGLGGKLVGKFEDKYGGGMVLCCPRDPPSHLTRHRVIVQGLDRSRDLDVGQSLEA